MSLSDAELEAILAKAVASPHGIEVTSTDAQALRRKLYAHRKHIDGAENLMFRISPSNKQALWLIPKFPTNAG